MYVRKFVIVKQRRAKRDKIIKYKKILVGQVISSAKFNSCGHEATQLGVTFGLP